jgi:hypothetical protein
MPEIKQAPLAACSLVAAGLLAGSPALVQASVIAASDLSFSSFSVTPASGTAELTFDWELSTSAEARNSLGEIDTDGDFSFIGGTITADAMVTWAEAGSSVTASTDFPPFQPDSSIGGSADSKAEVPGEPTCKPERWASATGIGTGFNSLIVTGGVGTVDVDFGIDLEGDISVATDGCDSGSAWSELIFALEIFDQLPLIDTEPQEQIVLFRREKLECNGANCTKSVSVDGSLTATRTLEYGIEYFFVLEVDSESEASVPVPPTALLILAGLAGLARLRRAES